MWTERRPDAAFAALRLPMVAVSKISFSRIIIASVKPLETQQVKRTEIRPTVFRSILGKFLGILNVGLTAVVIRAVGMDALGHGLCIVKNTGVVAGPSSRADALDIGRVGAGLGCTAACAAYLLVVK